MNYRGLTAPQTGASGRQGDEIRRELRGYKGRRCCDGRQGWLIVPRRRRQAERPQAASAAAWPGRGEEGAASATLGAQVSLIIGGRGRVQWGPSPAPYCEPPVLLGSARRLLEVVTTPEVLREPLGSWRAAGLLKVLPVPK